MLLVPVASRFRIAPVVEIPVPEIVKGSAIESPAPLTCTAAPDDTVVPVDDPPNADAVVATTTPAAIDVVPV